MPREAIEKAMTKTHFTDVEKRRLFQDGFVVLKNAVPREITARARELIEAGMPKHDRRRFAPIELAKHDDMLRLFKGSSLSEVLKNEMGPFPDVISCQIAVTPGHDDLGGRPGPHAGS